MSVAQYIMRCAFCGRHFPNELIKRIKASHSKDGFLACESCRAAIREIKKQCRNNFSQEN